MLQAWLFNWLAPHYDRLLSPLSMVDAERLLPMLELRGGEHILDVAGGTGRLAHAIVDRYRVWTTVLDSSARMLAQVPTHGHLKTVHSPAHSLPFRSESFDWVVCTAAFHLLCPHALTLSAMRRVLKPSGRLLLLDYDAGSLAGPLLARGQGMLGEDVKFLSAAEVEALATAQGFTGGFLPYSPLHYLYLGVKSPD